MNSQAAHSIAALNTGATLNPERHIGEYADTDQVVYVLQREGSKTMIALSSFGTLTGHPGVDRGYMDLHADQTGRDMGRYIIMGMTMARPDEERLIVGEAPNRKLRHYVAK